VAAKKKPSAKTDKCKGIAGTANDPRKAAKWLFAAVLVGHKGKLCTMENGLKRMSFMWLPAPVHAGPKGPRGAPNMAKALSSCVAKKSFVVHDKWLGTEKAVRDLGYRSAPSVNHSAGFREVESGWHSNDIESVFNSYKGFIRARYRKMLTYSTSLSVRTSAVTSTSSCGK
jgi:hypothetical protein